MSDRKHDSQEDLAIEQAWNQVMATGNEPRLLRGGEGANSEQVREYTELLGLLPYELTPEVPSPHVKEAIMARVGAGVAAATSTEGSGTETSEASPLPFERPANHAPPAQKPIWRFAQAAVLAASLVGLGFMSATVWQQNRQIDQLSQQVVDSNQRQIELLQAREETQKLQQRLNMVTQVARYAYPMRTVSTGASGELAGRDQAQKPEGIVYVCGMHQQWYLSLRGLEPPAEGNEYHLWFMTEEGKMDGGVLDVKPGDPSEMAAQSMPKGTQGFLVTLETPDEPEGLEILLGESPVNL